MVGSFLLSSIILTSTSYLFTEPFIGLENEGLLPVSFICIKGFKWGFTLAFESSKIRSILG
jgi:hypothetical protein